MDDMSCTRVHADVRARGHMCVCVCVCVPLHHVQSHPIANDFAVHYVHMTMLGWSLATIT